MAEFIRAAGGVVWRNHSRLQLAVIRDYKDEWSLPKGKLERNEKWERAAIREVKEETKCVAKICKFGSVSHYWVKNRPKIVVFFDMVVEKEEQFKPSGEVRALKWITPDEALRQLTHLQERQVLQACLEVD